MLRRFSSGARHDEVVALVDRMLEMNKKKHSVRLARSELERLEREIASTDRETDNMVYEFHGVTDEERRTIQAAQCSVVADEHSEQDGTGPRGGGNNRGSGIPGAF
jgi:phosphoenolpyruvate-protein kinase (PTS system EI component)